MKYLIAFLVIFIAFSCQKEHGKEFIGKMQYVVDTVIVDSNGQIFDLSNDILKSDLNEGNSSLFLFNRFDHSIDLIDLDSLKIVRKFLFEAEGSEGIGEIVNFINLVQDSLVFIKSYNNSGVFDLNGKSIKRIDWINSVGSKGETFGDFPKIQKAINSVGLRVFGITYDNYGRNVFLDILSAQENEVSRVEIDAEKSYHDFVLAIDDPAGYFYLDPLVFLGYENDFILVSHQFSNEVYLFNPDGSFYKTAQYEPAITPKRAKDPNAKSITSFEEIKEKYQFLLEQVTFGPPVWDREKKRYMRLSASRIFSDIRSSEHALLPDLDKVKVFLTVFDQEFNLISEVHIPELSRENVKYFAKDGKLWVFQNIDDELGFVVLTIL